MLLHTEARKLKPRVMPEDLVLSTKAWGAAQEALQELPPRLIKKIVFLYSRFDDLNANVQRFARAFDRYDALPADGAQEAVNRCRRELNVLLDVFNTGLDKAIDECKELLAELKRIGKIKEDKAGEPLDFGARVRNLTAEREQRLKLLAEMDEPPAEEGRNGA
jgi:hypothetical protein